MKRFLPLLLALGAAAALGGCGQYARLECPAPQPAATAGAAPDSAAAPLVSLSWRELFADPHLAAWIDSALARNTDLQIARLRAEQAEATLGASRLAMLPAVSLGAEASAGHRTESRFRIGPAATWEIDLFGRQRNTRLGAEASLRAAEAYRQAVETRLIAAVAEGYYALLMLDQQLAVSRRTLKTWDENIRALQALKRAGRTNEAAVLQARANRMKVESSALTLDKQISEQENAIRALLADPGADLARGELAAQVFPDSLLEGIPAQVLSNRPDVREAEYGLQRAFYGIRVARAAFYPTLTLSGNAGWSAASGMRVGSPSAWIANALASLAAPLFSRGTNRANLAIARADYDIAELEFRQKLVEAGREVNDALAAWQTASRRLVLDKKQIVALKGAVHNTRLLMRHTSTNYLEVLTAQQRLLEAELTEVNDRYEAIQAVIALYHAVGGGTR